MRELSEKRIHLEYLGAPFMRKCIIVFLTCLRFSSSCPVIPRDLYRNENGLSVRYRTVSSEIFWYGHKP